MTPEARQQIRDDCQEYLNEVTSLTLGGRSISGRTLVQHISALLAALDEAEKEVAELRAFSATCSQIAREEESENSRLQQERDEALAAMSADVADVVLAKCVAERERDEAVRLLKSMPKKTDGDVSAYAWLQGREDFLRRLQGEARMP